MKNALAMHRGERQGVLLILLFIVGCGAWITYARWRGPDPAEMAEVQQRMDSWLAERSSALVQRSQEEVVTTELFPFDPNTASTEEWQRLGLTPKQARSVGNYLANGGSFRFREDLSRMRSLRPDQVRVLLPYVQLPSKEERRPSRGSSSNGAADFKHDTATWERPYDRAAKAPVRKLEVNTCDSAQLVALPGVGPSFARGILRYRTLLGGYADLDQLAEVKVLKDKPDALANLRELLMVDTSAIIRIPLNTCTVEQLADHPYVDWKLAKALVAYRTQHGLFKEVVGIRGCVLVDDSLFRKLAPYFSTE
ncbi:MAG: helix-hairpin-helix domain-containing protein [Flavobacteriales bacterium]|nr:helix-hairpin-helix domain-containing protein [Flavobacteriales bacterium]MBK6754648.1 helix-hairpin-helix domain-containing protein [Flavobacteriales bacterium]MBK7085860.1 helix-hairpin-helix domain-containing protein [Flavobacteriales bacterium]MBK7268594.1 helix-hairpin-helix domain-containing protein [Flavobacteriales bacterium]MBK7754332.1 helix-hairpin-helix domain-containing protein [Flavobacteriales bacterium]